MRRRGFLEAWAHPGLRRLVALRVLSQGCDGLYQGGALVFLAFRPGGVNPARDFLVLLAATLLPFTLVGPFTGPVIDSLDRRSLLVGASILRAAGVGAMALLPPRPWAFAVLAVLVLSVNRFFLAAASAVIPLLVPEEILLPANALPPVAGTVATLVGATAAGVLSSAWSPSPFLLGALGLGAAAWVASGLPRVPPRRTGLHLFGGLGLLREVWEGAARVARAARGRLALGAVFLEQVLVGSLLGLALWFLVRSGYGPSSYSVLVGVSGAGAFFGAGVAPRAGTRAGEGGLLLLGLALTSLALGGAATGRVGLVLASAGLAGLAYSLLKVGADTLLQKDLPDAFRGRGFAFYDLLWNLGRVAGAGAAALLLPVWGLWASGMALSGVGAAGGAGVGLGLTRRGGGIPYGQPPGRPDWGPGEKTSVLVRWYEGAYGEEVPRSLITPWGSLEVRAVLLERKGPAERRFVLETEAGVVRLWQLEGGWWAELLGSGER